MTLCMLTVHISCMAVLYISIIHSSVEVAYPDTLRTEGVQMFTSETPVFERKEEEFPDIITKQNMNTGIIIWGV